MPIKIEVEAYGCRACGEEFFGPNALYDAQQCEKRDAVRSAHESGLHTWYCSNCKRFYKSKLEEAKCPKCGALGERICRQHCRGGFDVDLLLIDKDVTMECVPKEYK